MLHTFQIRQLHCALHILSSEVLTTPICSVSGAFSLFIINKPICTVTHPLYLYPTPPNKTDKLPNQTDKLSQPNEQTLPHLYGFCKKSFFFKRGVLFETDGT